MVGIPLPAYQRRNWLFQRCGIFLHPATPLLNAHWYSPCMLQCYRIWCKVNAYSGEVIHYKSIPIWRLKSFIQFYKCSDPRSTPWLGTNRRMLCHSTHWHTLDTFQCQCFSITVHILCQYKQLLEIIISLVFVLRCLCSGLDTAWHFSLVIANSLSPHVCFCLAETLTVKERL